MAADLKRSRGATGRNSAIGRSIEEEREIKQAAQWAAAKQSAARWGIGCLALAILFLCFVFYAAGWLAGAAEARLQ